LAEPSRQAFSAFSLELRGVTDRHVNESMAAALDAAWDAGLRDVIARELAEIRDRIPWNLGMHDTVRTDYALGGE